MNSGTQLLFSENLSLLTPATVEAIEVRCADQALVIGADSLQQQALPLGIEFRQHVIQQQKRGFPAQIGDQLKLRQLEGQHKRALLSR